MEVGSINNLRLQNTLNQTAVLMPTARRGGRTPGSSLSSCLSILLKVLIVFFRGILQGPTSAACHHANPITPTPISSLANGKSPLSGCILVIWIVNDDGVKGEVLLGCGRMDAVDGEQVALEERLID